MEEKEDDSLESAQRDSTSNRFRKVLTIEWTLVLYKIQYFFLVGTEEIDRVFLKLMLKQGGMTATQIGVIAGLSPMVASLSTLMVSVLANRYRISKAVLLIASAATATVAYCTAIIPRPGMVSNCTELALPPNITSLNAETLTDVSFLYDKGDLQVYFYTQLMANMGFWIFRSLTLTFTDVALISFLGEAGMFKYASQKSFGALGSTILSLSTGAVVAMVIIRAVVCDVELWFEGYTYAYYIAGAAMTICFLVSWSLKFENEQGELLDKKAAAIALSVTPVPSPQHSEGEDDSANLSITRKKKKKTGLKTDLQSEPEDDKFSFKTLMSKLLSVHYVSWILMVFLISLCWSVSTYTYLYLEELGGDALLIGVVGGVTSGSDFVFFLSGFWIVQKLGTTNSLCFALMVKVVRFTILALIIDPWLGVLSAALDGASMAVGWVAMIQHVSDGFPASYSTTVIGIVHGTYYGIGFGTGQLVGGVVLDAVGGRYTFAAFAGAMTLFTVLFYIVQKLSKRPMFEDDHEKLVAGLRRGSYPAANEPYLNESYGT